MKKIIFLHTILVFFLAFNAFGQISQADLIGRWGLIDFELEAKNKSGKLSQKEINTIRTMKDALKANPKFMHLTFREDGAFITEPSSPEIGYNARWEYRDGILYIQSDKGVDKHTARLINGNLEFKPIRSREAIPVMILEKD